MIVTDCLGRERSPEKVFPDGSYNCPFCCAAVLAAWDGCQNPACLARVSPPYPAARAISELAEQEKRQGEEDARVTNHRIWLEQQRADHEEKIAWESEQLAECDRRGACRRCLFPSGYRSVKFIRHRRACPRNV